MVEYNFMNRFSEKQYKLSNYLKKTLNKDMKILDVGVGRGGLSNAIDFKKYVGVDISKETVNNLKKNNFETYLCSAEEIGLKFQENSFDCIFMSHVIEHLNINQIISFMKASKKILKENGKLIIASPSTSCFFFFSEWTHIRPYDYASLTGLFKDFGFKNIIWNYTYIYFLPKIIQKLLCKFKIGTIMKEIIVIGDNFKEK